MKPHKKTSNEPRSFRIGEPTHEHRPRRRRPHLVQELIELGDPDGVAASLCAGLRPEYRDRLLHPALSPAPVVAVAVGNDVIVIPQDDAQTDTAPVRAASVRHAPAHPTQTDATLTDTAQTVGAQTDRNVWVSL